MPLLEPPHRWESMQKRMHHGFETYRRRHQKNKTGVPIAPRNLIMEGIWYWIVDQTWELSSNVVYVPLEPSIAQNLMVNNSCTTKNCSINKCQKGKHFSKSLSLWKKKVSWPNISCGLMWIVSFYLMSFPDTPVLTVSSLAINLSHWHIYHAHLTGRLFHWTCLLMVKTLLHCEAKTTKRFRLLYIAYFYAGATFIF